MEGLGQNNVTGGLRQVSPEEFHDQNHFGVERSWFLTRQVDPSITKEQMKAVLRSCEQCQSIDPCPIRHEAGELSVSKNWERLAIDVTHYHGVPYLSMVDCDPGRFAIWRRLKNEQTEQIISELAQVFYERGPVTQVLTDNASSFRSEVFFRNFLAKWNVQPFFRAAYRPGGKGIVERNHRTIKAIAERGDMSPEDTIFYYNCSPRSGQEDISVPQRSVMRYEWRLPIVVPEEQSNESSPIGTMGDEVWVKPPEAKCTTQWNRGVVTKINSANNIEVNNTPRHILDVRVAGDREAIVEQGQVQEEQPQLQVEAKRDRRYPYRHRQAPAWHGDYEVIILG